RRTLRRGRSRRESFRFPRSSVVRARRRGRELPAVPLDGADKLEESDKREVFRDRRRAGLAPAFGAVQSGTDVPRGVLMTISDEFMQGMLAAAKPYCLVIFKAAGMRSRDGAKAIIWEHARRNFELRAEGRLAI